jgi:hypothetical protein
MTNPNEELEEQLYQASLLALADFGPAENAWHPQYGQIIKDGELTPEGIEMFKQAEIYRT